MLQSRKLFIGSLVLGIAVFGAAAFGAVWYTQLRETAPAGVDISSAVESIQPAGQSPVDSANLSQSGSDLTGNWKVIADGASFVGYRVKEELNGIGSTTAVGRTTSVTADLQFNGEAITAVNVSAAVRQLVSDNTMRDGQLRRQALETDQYPTATFTLTQPIAIDSVPDEGQTVAVTAVGDLTLHGVKRQVSVPLQGQFVNGQLAVVGSLQIAFPDYNITPPSSLSVLSVENVGVMELQLLFQKANV